ncbi:MAG: glycosyltransferase family 2 protein [Dehalococcoidales bacterium]|jgi:glycosyltransferase involved in cell wall biosynthesis
MNVRANIDTITYVIISPVRNEEKFIEKTIQSVTAQSILPFKWIIVNDGSTDGTNNIIDKYANAYNWITIVNRADKGHRPGEGPSGAFNEGLKYLDCDYDFIINLDGDVSFEPRYFEKLFAKFDKNPGLGIASGKSYYLEKGNLVQYKCADISTMGPSKVYRKKCFSDIGKTLQEHIGWDMLDDLRAQMNGWETRSFSDLSFIHYKKIGQKRGNIFIAQFRSGRDYYSLGYHPIFMVAKCIYRVKDRPFLLGSVLIILGYTWAFFKKEKIILDNESAVFLRKRQMKQLQLRLKIPD